MGLFGGSSTSQKRTTDQKQGFSDITGPVSNLGVSGDVGTLTYTSTDHGAVAGGLDLASKALDVGQAQSRQAVEAVKETASSFGSQLKQFATQQSETQGQQLAKLAAITAVGLVAINAWRKRSAA